MSEGGQDGHSGVMVDRRVVELLQELTRYTPSGERRHTMLKRADGFMQIVIPADAPKWLKDQGVALWDNVMEWRNTL